MKEADSCPHCGAQGSLTIELVKGLAPGSSEKMIFRCSQCGAVLYMFDPDKGRTSNIEGKRKEEMGAIKIVFGVHRAEDFLKKPNEGFTMGFKIPENVAVCPGDYLSHDGKLYAVCGYPWVDLPGNVEEIAKQLGCEIVTPQSVYGREKVEP